MISDGYGKSLLVDSGDNRNRSVFDWLDANGYKKKEFDTLITHWHDDHAGNTAEIIRRYKVGTLYLPTLEYLDVDYPEYQGHYDYEKTIAQEVLKAAKECGTKLVYLEKGLTINVSEVTGEVLYCSDCPLKENWYAVQHVNNQSAAIMFSGGGVKLLMAGDVQAQAEKRILKSGVSIKADIFKLSHHGMDRTRRISWTRSTRLTPGSHPISQLRNSLLRRRILRTASPEWRRCAKSSAQDTTERSGSGVQAVRSRSRPSGTGEIEATAGDNGLLRYARFW